MSSHSKLLLSIVAVFAIGICGSIAFFLFNPTATRPPTQTTLSQEFSLPNPDNISIIARSNPTTQQIELWLSPGAVANELGNLDLRINFSNSSAFTTIPSQFNAAAELVSGDWKIPFSTITEVNTNTFLVELALIRQSGEPFTLESETLLGTLTLPTAISNLTFTIDPDVSNYFDFSAQQYSFNNTASQPVIQL